MVSRSSSWHVYRAGRRVQLVEGGDDFLAHPPPVYYWRRGCDGCHLQSVCATGHAVRCQPDNYRRYPPAELWLVYQSQTCCPRMYRVRPVAQPGKRPHAIQSEIPWNGDAEPLLRSIPTFDARRALPGGKHLRN